MTRSQSKAPPSHAERFAMLIAVLAEGFNQELTPAKIEAYRLGVGDLPLDKLEIGVRRSVRESLSFMPTPGELRKLCGELDAKQRAVNAWTDVLSAIPYGPYKHMDFEDRLINAVVRNLGGWPALCDRFKDSDEENWARKDFIKAYESMASSGVNGELLRPVPGLSEKTSIGGKLVDPEPKRIGCESDRKALPFAVTESGKLTDSRGGEIVRPKLRSAK